MRAFYNIELRHLRYFVAVAQQGSIRAAAEQLNISQPPLGRQIRQIEEELDATLFKREPKGMVLTEAGRELLCHSLRILQDAQDSAERTSLVAQGKLGTLRIEFSDDFLYGPLASLIHQFVADNPKVTLEARMDFGARIVKRVESGEIDIGLVVMPVSATAAGLHALNLEPIPIVAALPEDHPLAKRSAIRIAELANDTFICAPINPDAGLYMATMSLLRQAEISPRLMTNIWPTELQLELTAVGTGVTLLGLDKARPIRSGVVFVPLIDQAAAIQGCFVWRPDSSHRASVNRFLEFIRGQSSAI